MLQTHREALAPLLLDGLALGENLQGFVFSDLAQLRPVPQGQERHASEEHVISPPRDKRQNLGCPRSWQLLALRRRKGDGSSSQAPGEHDLQ